MLSKKKYLVLLLHGYGANGINLEPLKKDLDISNSDIELVFYNPDAPFKYEFDDNSTNSYQWFSLASRDDEYLWNGAEKARLTLDKMLEKKLTQENIPYGNIIGIGFSQGTMIGLHTFLQNTKSIKGFIGFSGTLIAPKKIQNKIKNADFPVCLINGDLDDIIPLSLGKIAHNYLTEIGVKSEFHKINNLYHSIDNRGIAIAKSFISKILDMKY